MFSNRDGALTLEICAPNLSFRAAVTAAFSDNCLWRTKEKQEVLHAVLMSQPFRAPRLSTS